jgi:YD repeat-containing protein
LDGPTPPTGAFRSGFSNQTSVEISPSVFCLFECNLTKSPGSLPFFPAIAPPPACPIGKGAISFGNSTIDNLQFSHLHEAVDYGDPQATPGGCGPCGSKDSAAEGALPRFSLRRFHRYRDQDQFGHFGPGVFSNFDIRIQLDTASNTMLFWDPQNPLELELAEGTVPGAYSDARFAQVHSAELLDAAGAHAADDTTATWAEVRTWDGRRYRFELFSLRSGDLGTRSGRLVRITDRAGNEITVSYIDSVTSTDAALGYDRARLWRIATTADAYGKVATWSWIPHSGAWVAASVLLPNGNSIFYDYDRTGLVGLDRVRHPDGTTSTFTTTADVVNQQQVIAIEDAAASDIHRRKTSHVTWSAMNDQLGISGSEGTVPVAPNRVRMVKNGAGEVSHQNWGQSYGSAFVTYVYEGGKSANDPGTLMRYETRGGAPYRVSRATSFTITGWEWNAAGWEAIEEYGVAADTRISRRIDALRRQIAFSRDASGAITAEVRYKEDGTTQLSSATTTYNEFQQPLSTVDHLGRQTEYTYDPNGNRLTKKAAPNLPEESLWSWTYNSRGQPLTATDANGNVTTYVYGEVVGSDNYKRLIGIVEPADVAGGPQATTVFTYDSAGRLATVTDAANRVTTYAYDSRNRPSSIVYADGTTETWTYGTTPQTANLVVAHQDRNGNVETSTYDDAGRRTGLTIAGPGGSPVVGIQSWTYLPGKDLVKTVSDNGELTVYGMTITCVRSAPRAARVPVRRSPAPRSTTRPSASPTPRTRMVAAPIISMTATTTSCAPSVNRCRAR